MPADDGPGLLAESRRLNEENDNRAKPLASEERIDPNRASEVELDRLPGLGPAAARAIVAAREKSGDFRVVDDLLDVPGIGPATLQRIRPFVELSPARRAPPRTTRSAPARPRPESGTQTAPRATPTPLDLNRATAAELERLPGVGPALAGRILEARAAQGGFRATEDLLEVRGIGAATLARLRSLVRVGGGAPD